MKLTEQQQKDLEKYVKLYRDTVTELIDIKKGFLGLQSQGYIANGILIEIEDFKIQEEFKKILKEKSAIIL